MYAQAAAIHNPHNANVIELISRIAASAPDAIAIRDAPVSLSFAELDIRSNRLAHALRAQGVRTGDAIALLIPRSTSFVTAALAAMKAGGAYLPIDPEYPSGRIEHILRDSGAVCILTGRDQQAQIPAGAISMVVDETFSSYPRTAPPLDLRRDDLAYIIYTSGSTGQPKGVELLHAGLSNLIAWHIRAFSLQPSDRSSQLASVGFDAAVWEIWPVLCAGASLAIPDELAKRDPVRLRDWIVRERLTVSFVPTCMAEMLLALPWPAETALRYLLTGADVLRRYPQPGLPFQVVNNYGPTECTVVATSGVVPAAVQRKQLPSIGRAIDDVDVCILDPQLRPVPTGMSGEICIAGASLARGYRNNAALTAERFVTVQSENGPVRMYRTGDLGLIPENGEIEFRGRADDQVKIRGYRIELQEIALALNRHPDVRASAVVAGKNSHGDEELIAYIVAQGNSGAPEWAAHLALSLPRYMIPSIFVPVPELPSTPNGKLDRAALPPPPAVTASRTGFVAPRSLVEERMEKLVAQLLGVDSVSVRDNLFLLGGHSLFGAQLISRVRNNFGVELPLRKVFEQPTVELLSQQVELALMARLRASGAAGLSAQ
jgi:amino acid adenylation domain-containing protein